MRSSLLCFALISSLTLWSGLSATSQEPAAPALQKGGGAKATPVERIRMAKDFKIELIHAVPRATQGSWVSMCVDPQGRLIVCDQGNAGLFRITPPPLGGKASETNVEKLPIDISEAHGLLWAFDSLYVMVNSSSKSKRSSGLYRVTASKPGGELDDVKLLRALNGKGDHGPHAIVLSPDGKSLFVCAGNDTKVTSPLASSSPVPKLYAEDRLFPIIASFQNVVAPAGCTYRVDPDGKNWELWSAGYRNHYDIAFNRHGDLFTFDSDMEYDVNAPWYRPTRVLMSASGSDLGFRNGSHVFPPRYADSLPEIINIGPGSPTGIGFGYGAKFPAKYQEALYICDWSYGRLFAVHLTPEGSAYKAQVEEFATGSPLPLTDLVVNPKDGALYFVMGGRSTQSAMYRITYTGKESTAPAKADKTGTALRALRHMLEALHGTADPKTVEIAWPYLNHEDRFIRFAARVAIEHQNVKEWQHLALAETKPYAALQALLALARAGSADTKAPILTALERIDWTKLTDSQRSDMLRVYTVLFSRHGKPDETARLRFIWRFEGVYPTSSYEVNADLCELLVYTEAPGVAGKTLKLMKNAPTQEQQMEFARSLSNLKKGWAIEERREYFTWFQKAAGYKGGQTFQTSVVKIRDNARATLSAEEKLKLQDLKDVLEAKKLPPAPVAKPRPFVKNWTVAELTPIVETGLKKRDFERGRLMFAEAKCFVCHRYDNEGGALGPDLTAASGRFNVPDLLESIIEPSKVISDQYAAMIFTFKNGKVVTGRIVNLHGDENIAVQTDMLNPAVLAKIGLKDLESVVPSPVSPMPEGLLDTFRQDEILDLMAYVLSRGNRKHEMFQK
ncbi:MAG TPA: heme-binding protein [Gemmataceae bacterium]|nr:heme-binding protein [Gemmataceae bacterium]